MAGPKAFQGIMISSTFSDLKWHRDEVIRAINGMDFHPIVMESSGANADKDVIQTSLRMVERSAALVSAISHRYGQTPYCETNNPDALSITELEFNKAMELGIPILLFLMADDHQLTKADVETDSEKMEKLDAFRARAKKMRHWSDVERVYETFSSQEDFSKKSTIALANLTKLLERAGGSRPGGDPGGSPEKPVDTLETAKAPELRALPRYLGSHDFLGRGSELDRLDAWCAAADPHPMLLFEAIGGTGKSMVTWTWLTKYSDLIRDDWAGKFWFSFYEGGATMRAFCQEALAYMTGRSVREFRKQSTRALIPDLIACLDANPWLLVLDGLERILVAYHRIDASQMRDEDVDTATDPIRDRDPRNAINPEDEELLRKLAAVSKSKVLVSSRLTPRALFNNAQMPIPGVRREILQGLRPEDAEGLFKACGASGESATIRDYLQSNCDCHPMVIGALAGLINANMRHRGDFDAWLADPDAGGKLGLADLDLIQSRNHILDAAIDALDEPGRQLLRTLSLLNSGADYETLSAFNPHMPPRPEEPHKKDVFALLRLDEDARAAADADYKSALSQYEEDLVDWEASPEVAAAPARFDETLRQIELRGLMQYERGLQTYDLHPVVRGVVSGGLSREDARTIGEGVVDYLSSKPHDPWEEAVSLKDVDAGIRLLQTLTHIGSLDQAFDVFAGELSGALLHNLMAYKQVQQILRPFFTSGLDGDVDLETLSKQSTVLNAMAQALESEDPARALGFSKRALAIDFEEENARAARVRLTVLAALADRLGDLEATERLSTFMLNLGEAIGQKEGIFVSLFFLFAFASKCGDVSRANALWARLDPMGRDWSRNNYQGGGLERVRAEDLFYRGELADADIATAETLCFDATNRYSLCKCLSLRGEWHLSRGEPGLAIEPLTEALKLFRESGNDAPRTEALFALAQLRAQADNDASGMADRYDSVEGHETALVVAEIWEELGETERAVKAALRAHRSAIGRGEPYVYRYSLDRATALLTDLGQTPPTVPRHDPSQDEVFEWEDDLRALIEKTRQEREERERRDAKRKKGDD